MPLSVRGRKRIKKLSKRQERKTAAGIGAKRQPASGSLTGYKGDSRLLGVVRVEDKFTFNKSYPLKQADLAKIRGECSYGEIPAFKIDFKTEESGRTYDSWVLIPHAVWERLINAIDDDS